MAKCNQLTPLPFKGLSQNSSLYSRPGLYSRPCFCCTIKLDHWHVFKPCAPALQQTDGKM